MAGLLACPSCFVAVSADARNCANCGLDLRATYRAARERALNALEPAERDAFLRLEGKSDHVTAEDEEIEAELRFQEEYRLALASPDVVGQMVTSQRGQTKARPGGVEWLETTMPTSVAYSAHEEAINVVRRVNLAGGFLSLGLKDVDVLAQETRELNNDGYRVSILVGDSFSFVENLLWLVVLIMTIGFYTRRPGFVLVGERWRE